MKVKPLRAAIIGAGYIAEFHARAIRATEGVELVSVCDANLTTAQTFAAEQGIPNCYDSMDDMLSGEQLDVVHILVPPDKHYPVAKAALQAGLNIFLEKPMCTSVEDADDLLNLAHDKKLCVGVNHNFLYSEAYQQLRQIVRSGAIGPLSHVQITHFFELAQLRSGPFDAWMLRTPENIILEIGPHLTSAAIDLVGLPGATAVTADRSMKVPGGKEAFRRWQIRVDAGSAAVDININVGPGFSQRTISVHGLFGSAVADLDANICVVDRRTPLSVDFDRYRRSRSIANQIKHQARKTLTNYILSRLRLRRGGNPYQISIINSVGSFYAGLKADKALDSRVDGAFGRNVIAACAKIIEAADLKPFVQDRPRHQVEIKVAPSVLVIGATGFIGRHLVRKLMESGYGVRAMVRGSGAILDELGSDRLEVVRGDVRNKDDLKSSLAGIEFVYYLATSAGKTWDSNVQLNVEPARLVGEACLEAGIKRLIYTGTIDSYYAGAKAGTITEATPLDPNIVRRNYYARAKAAAEGILMELHRSRGLPVVIFRPGIVIGEGGNPFHWGVGRFTESHCEVWGSGNNKLPFVLVSDVAAALVRGIQVGNIEGHSYNLIDAPLLNARDYLKELERLAGIKLDIHYRPIWQYYLEDAAKWAVKLVVRHPDRIRVPSYRDWESRTQKATFDCQRARTELGWSPASDRQRLIDEGIGKALKAWLAACR